VKIEVLEKNDTEKDEQLASLEKEKENLIVACDSCQSEDGENLACPQR